MSKLLLGELSPFQLAGLLYLGAGVGVLPAVVSDRRRSSSWPDDRKNVVRLAGAIVCGGVVGPVLLLLALRTASAASVSLWLNFELIATAVLGHFAFHDDLGRSGWLAVLGSVIAGCLLGFGERAAGLAPGMLVCAACLCWGVDNHLTALIDGIRPSQSVLWKGSVAGCVNVLIGITMQPYAASVGATGLALVVGALCYGASITLYIAAAQGIGATRAHVVFAGAPFLGAAMAVGLLGEPVAQYQIIAAGLLLASTALLFHDHHEHAHRHEVVAHTHAHEHGDGHHDHTHEAGARASYHSHRHEHEAESHSHGHWPDVHHRHMHRETG